MAQLPFAFNPAAVQPAQSNDVRPAGWYPAKGIIESELKQTNSGGQMIAITIELQSGGKVWHNFNIVNQSQQAVQMAYEDMAALCAALGIQHQVTDTTQLHNRPFDVKLRIEKSEGYDDKNVVARGGFAPLGGKADKYVEKAGMGSMPGAQFQPHAPQPPAMPQQASAFPQPPAVPQQAFTPPPPVQQSMPQFQPQAAPSAPFGQPQQPQQFAQQAPAQQQQQQWNPAAAQQAPQQQFQPHPSAPGWTQPR